MNGGVLSLICSWRVGWSPVGLRKVEVKVVEEGSGWWRAGNENSVGEGLVSSPTTVRKPARESSSLSMGFSLERIPISRRESERGWVRSRDQGWGDQNALMVRAWDMLSKSISTCLADTRLETRDWQTVESGGQSLCWMYRAKSSSVSKGE